MKNVKAILNGISRSLRFKAGSHHVKSTNGKPVFITLEEARKDPALVKKMTEQINEASIINGTQTEYVAEVKYKGVQYYIASKHSEWMEFYGMEDGGGLRA